MHQNTLRIKDIHGELKFKAFEMMSEFYFNYPKESFIFTDNI